MSDDRICIGSIGGAYGVQGEVRIKSFCAEPTAIADYGLLASEDGKQAFSLTLLRPIKNGFSVRIDGVATKEQADALKGMKLYVARAVLPALPDDEYYHADLVGLTVLDTGGQKLGQVHAVHNHGASDVLEVKLPGNSATVLLPFTLDAVPTVDLTSGRIVADPPTGVFPDAEDV